MQSFKQNTIKLVKLEKQILVDICIFPFKCNEVLSGK